MADLLSADVIEDILAAIHDTTDTFMKQPATFRLRKAKVGLFSDDKNARTTVTEVVVLGLFIPGPDDIESMATGQVDLTGGYLLCNREDLLPKGLADATGNLLVNPATDTVVIYGEEYKLRGAIPLGPLNGIYTLGKFLTTKQIKPNAP